MSRKVISFILSIILIISAVPINVFAANNVNISVTSLNSYEDTMTATVKYLDTERTKAQITYEKKGITPEEYNIVFLVDNSAAASETVKAFKQMMNEQGINNIYNTEKGSISKIQFISYNYNILQNKKSIGRESLSYNIHDLNRGEGNHDEVLALQTATSTLESIKANGKPTVIFWVLSNIYEDDRAQVEEELKTLDSKLGDKDALITWQLSEQADPLLQKYATEHKIKHENTTKTEANAESNATVFAQLMAEQIKSLANDFYHNINFSIKLKDGQSLVKEITNGEIEVGSDIASYNAKLSEDKKSYDISLNSVPSHTNIKIVLDVELDQEKYIEEEVTESVVISDNHTNGSGLDIGIFDENIGTDMKINIPSVNINRTKNTISFQGVDIEKIEGLSGSKVILPEYENKNGQRFGGWTVVSGINQGTHYDSGALINMPEGNMTLAPTYGHMEVDIDFEYEWGEELALGNTMGSYTFYDYSNDSPFEFDDAQVDGKYLSNDQLATVTFLDENVNYIMDTNSGDKWKVNIKSIEGKNSVDDIVYARHAGATDNDRVVVYLKKSTEYADMYDVFISGPDGVKAPENISGLFKGSSGIKKVDLENLDTSETTSFYSLFAGCSNLISVDFGNINTENVTTLQWMFEYCSSIEEIDLSCFNPQNITSMEGMFTKCEKLRKITFGENFNAASLSNMNKTFSGCKALIDIDLHNFKTSENLKSMFYTFSGCQSLISIDLTNFNTSNVNTMSNLFAGCKALTEIIYGDNFSTESVTDMDRLFYNCRSLTNVNLLNDLDTSNVKNMSYLFDDCKLLEKIDISNWDTSQVTNMGYMFRGCNKLSQLVLGENFNTSKVTNMSSMFEGCKVLTSFPKDKFDTTNVIYMDGMFSSTGFTTLNLENFITSNVKNINNMFAGCSNLTSINLSGSDTSNVINMSGLFKNCSALTDIDISSFNTSNVTNAYPSYANNDMFYGCTKLKSLNLGNNFYVDKMEDLKYMFYNTRELTTINGYIKFKEENNITSMSNMFGSTGLTELNFYVPPTGAKFPKLTNMSSMFYYTQISNIKFNNWTLPQLSDVRNMFYGCANSNIYLDWRGMEVEASAFNTGGMFNNSFKCNVTTGSDNAGTTQAILNKIKDELNKRSLSLLEDMPTLLPELPPLNNDEEVVVPPIDDENGVEEMVPPSDNNDEEIIPPIDDNNGEEILPEEDKNMDDSKELLSLNTTNRSLFARNALQKVAGQQAETEGIYVREEPVKPGDKITYTVTLRYEGDPYVESGKITIEFPIPEGIILHPDGDGISDISISYPDGTYLGGKVITQPYIDSSTGRDILKAEVKGIYTGAEIKIPVITQVQHSEYVDGERYWDAEAYAKDELSTVTSRTIRLWQKEDGSTTVPETEYKINYQYEGEIPENQTSPASQTVKANQLIQTHTVTVDNDYEFEGWIRSDNQEKVTPGDSIEISDNITLTGIWSKKETAKKYVEINYLYTADEEGNQPPENKPDLPDIPDIEVGKKHNIQPITEDVDYMTFNGWKPELTINSTSVALTISDDGATYEGTNNGKTYTINTSGILDTSQFLGNETVLLNFKGSWTPYKGTIHFDPNNGTGSISDLENVTYNSNKKIPSNTFASPDTGYTFQGWALSPNGAVVKSPGDNADQLIKTDGEEITLYAIWKRSEYNVGYKLSNMTSSNNQEQVSLNGDYATKLTVQSGYNAKEISITVGGVDKTNIAYDKATGNVTLTGINGDVLIKAIAEKIETTPGGGSGETTEKEYPIYVVTTGNGTASSNKRQAESGEKITINTEGEVISIVALDRDNKERKIEDLGNGKYTFTMPNSKVTVKVKFEGEKLPEIKDPEITGVASLLNTKEHNVYMGGYKDNTFKPENNITRAEVAQAFYNLLLDKSVEEEKQFIDVKESEWYYKAISVLSSKGIIGGYEDGTYRPEQAITRGEFTAIATNFAKASTEKQINFVDVKESDWYKPFVQTAVSYGWIGGYSDNTFKPENSITRAEVTVIVNNMLARIADIDAIDSGKGARFVDVPEVHWAFYNITEAATAHEYDRENNLDAESWKTK